VVEGPKWPMGKEQKDANDSEVNFRPGSLVCQFVTRYLDPESESEIAGMVTSARAIALDGDSMFLYSLLWF